VVEEESDAAGLAQRTGLEEVADFRRGSVPAIGEAFDDDRYFMRREAFVSHLLETDLLIGLAGAFFDGPFDGIAINRGFAGFFDGGGETRVEIGVRAAELGGNHDFADQFGDQLAFLLRIGFAPGLFPLCAQLSWLRIRCATASATAASDFPGGPSTAALAGSNPARHGGVAES
jgi:hypothetical protein